MISAGKSFLVFCAIVLIAEFCCAQTTTVSGTIAVEHSSVSAKRGKPNNSDVVVWLEPKQMSETVSSPKRLQWRLIQKNKQFIPNLLIVPVGSSVEFPNEDPFFHNVFSLFNGKRFDLSLYQTGESRGVKFDREGVSYIFCNIHPDMHAVVIALSTPLYAVSGPSGSFNIPNVPAGDYLLHVWYERTTPDVLHGLEHPLTISSSRTVLPLIRIPELQELSATHKNKFGKEYDRTQPTPLY